MNISEALFSSALCAYLSAFILYIFTLFKQKRFIRRVDVLLLALGFTVHCVSLFIKSLQLVSQPIRDPFYSINLFCWTLAGLALFLQWRVRMRFLAGSILFVILLFGFLAFSIPRQSYSTIPSFNAFCFGTHLLFSYAGYAAFLITFLSAVLYILLEKLIKRKSSSGVFYDNLPSLEAMEAINYRSLWAGVIMLALGLVFGFVWMHWEHISLPWYDSKVVSTLVTLVLYTLIIILRWLMKWRGKKVAYLAVIGFMFVLLTFVIVNCFTNGHLFHVVVES